MLDNQAGGASKSLKVVSLVQAMLLAIQFMIGMWINLFAPMNVTPPHGYFMMGYMMYYFSLIPLLAPHMAVGVIIGLLFIVILALSLLSRNVVKATLSVIGGIMTLMAGLAGMAFVAGGYQITRSL
jgi:predicted neutral ceramidase superfamily lipid hydrolase